MKRVLSLFSMILMTTYVHAEGNKANKPASPKDKAVLDALGLTDHKDPIQQDRVPARVKDASENPVPPRKAPYPRFPVK
jgi:hypothetical protein